MKSEKNSHSKPRIALVVPRFSEKISGGAEKHAFCFAELLSVEYEVTVLTTTATDYTTWRNELIAGEKTIGNIRVIRFKSDYERNMHSFNKLSGKISKKFPDVSAGEYERWLRSQGPVTSSLVSYIESNSENFELFFFISYLYFPVVKGIQAVKEKSLCLLTLHDEFPAYFPIYKQAYTNEISYTFNTMEEFSLFKRIFSYEPSNYSVIGMNIEPVQLKADLPQTDSKYILYIGRLDRGKGIDDLINFFIQWKESADSPINLILVGAQNANSIPHNAGIVFAGFVSEEEKIELIRNAMFIVNPSPLESFSIVTMESWNCGTPVLVNAASEVLKWHCIRSNGGLYYSDFDSFCATMNYLCSHPKERDLMGSNGKKYVELNYSNEVVRKKLFSLVNQKLNLVNHPGGKSG
ncbi:MAG: glycosyltransferase family 4 protein [Leptospira sp.]|nr:glycosyltransferase family 4 protein [Leptospira sp.]